MRTYEEIRQDIDRATSTNDVSAMQTLASEVMSLGTTQAEALAACTLGLAYRIAGSYDLASDQLERAVSLYEELGDRRGMALSFGRIGTTHWNMGAYPLALTYHERALGIYEEIGDHAGIAMVTGNMGNVYMNIGNYPKALELFGRTMASYEEIGDRASIAGVAINIASIYGTISDYVNSVDYLGRARSLYEELGDRSGAARAATSIGIVLGMTGDHSGALEHLRSALEIHEELGDRVNLANVVENVGSVFASLGDHQQALENYERALALWVEIGNRRGIAAVPINISAVLIEQGNVEEAERLLEDVRASKIDDPAILTNLYANLSSVAEYRGDLVEALRSSNAALDVASQAGLRSMVADCHIRLRELARKSNDLDGYVHHNSEYLRLTEEIRGNQATRQLAMMEAQHAIAAERLEREKERALLYSALPQQIAERMLRGEDLSGDQYDDAVVLFLDITESTSHSADLDAKQVISLLADMFNTFDDIMSDYQMMKIKTIGDAYMAVAFGDVQHEPLDVRQRSEVRAARAATALMASSFAWPNGSPVQFRIGLHIGPLVAGVIGKQRLQYDVWGDTVNVASRMESTSEPGRIQVSEAFALKLGARGEERGGSGLRSPLSALRLRGEVEVKGKGLMKTYWLESA